MKKKLIAWLLGALILLLGAFILYKKQSRIKPAFYSGKEKSIAVLPFINTDGAKELDYLSEGMTDEIIHRLSGITGLRVVSPSLVRAVATTHVEPVQAAAELKVGLVIVGKISKAGQTVKIHVDLMDTGGDKVWSRDFETTTGELFSFQNELAQVVTEELHTEMTLEEKKRLNTRPTQSLEAYDQYLKGIYFWNKRDANSLRKGVEFFNQAIVLDSNYAQAWSGLADCYSALGYGSHDAPSFDFLKAEAAARRALGLNPSLAEPHTSLGYIDFYYYWNWEEAEKEFRTAIQLNPEYPLAHDAYVYFLTARERFAEAGVEMEKAYALDPASPFIQTDRGFALYYAGHSDRAIPVLKEVLERYPAFPLAWLWLGRSLQEKKDFPESLNAYTLSLRKDSLWPVALAAGGFVYGLSGQEKAAEKRLKQMTELMKIRYVTPYGMALLYAGMKNKNKTFEWLNKAFSERTHWLVWLKLDPRWSFIKNDPRYIGLLQKIGLNLEKSPLRRN